MKLGQLPKEEINNVIEKHQLELKDLNIKLLNPEYNDEYADFYLKVQENYLTLTLMK